MAAVPKPSQVKKLRTQARPKLRVVKKRKVAKKQSNKGYIPQHGQMGKFLESMKKLGKQTNADVTAAAVNFGLSKSGIARGVYFAKRLKLWE